MYKIMLFSVFIGFSSFNIASDRSDGFQTPPRRPNPTLEYLDQKREGNRKEEKVPKPAPAYDVVIPALPVFEPLAWKRPRSR